MFTAWLDWLARLGQIRATANCPDRQPEKGVCRSGHGLGLHELGCFEAYTIDPEPVADATARRLAGGIGRLPREFDTRAKGAPGRDKPVPYALLVAIAKAGLGA